MNRQHLYLLALALTVTGLAIFAYKWKVLGFPLASESVVEAWTVEAKVTFSKARTGPVKVILAIPAEPRAFAVLDEQFISRGYGLTVEGEPPDRRVVWAIRRAQGEQALYYRATITPAATEGQDERPPPFPPVPELEEPYATALQELVDRVREESADIATFAAAALRIINEPRPEEAVRLFLGPGATELDRARFARTLLEAARIPTDVLQALRLAEDRRDMTLEPWIRVHTGDRWIYFDLREGQRGLPGNLLVWHIGDGPVVQVDGARGEEVTFATRKMLEDALRVAEIRASHDHPRIVEFSLLDLPLATQAVYAILLMVPVGAFLVAVLRNVVGISTFGTFMPVLVAMAFRETQLFTGILLFTLIVALGLAIRFYLEKLRLLLVPRLASVLTVVVLLMAVVSIISHRMGIEIGLSVALFPMVIMTMTIERMSIVWEERGPGEALKEGVGTLVVAAFVYLVMDINAVKHFVLVFPELLLVVLAGTLLLGRYTGYRLTELTRFSALAPGHRQ
ncbi:MAG: UUP1 family membrane protein [Gammaproteobacteria bacterium]